MWVGRQSRRPMARPLGRLTSSSLITPKQGPSRKDRAGGRGAECLPLRVLTQFSRRCVLQTVTKHEPVLSLSPGRGFDSLPEAAHLLCRGWLRDLAGSIYQADCSRLARANAQYKQKPQCTRDARHLPETQLPCTALLRASCYKQTFVSARPQLLPNPHSCHTSSNVHGAGSQGQQEFTQAHADFRLPSSRTWRCLIGCKRAAT